MSQTFGDVMKAQRQKRIALIVKAKMGPPPPPNYTDAGNAKEQGTHQINPMRGASHANQYTGPQTSKDPKAQRGGVTHRPDGKAIQDNPVKGSVAERRNIAMGAVVNYQYVPIDGMLHDGRGTVVGFVDNRGMDRNGSLQDVVIRDGANVKFVAERNVRGQRIAAGKDTSIDFAFDETNPKSVEAVRRQAADLVTNVSDTTRSQIRDLVEQAFTDPEMDVHDLADEIEGIVNDEDRADLIARTETMRASNEGQQDAWDQAIEDGALTGNEQKEWIATSDQRCCDVCDDLDGESVGVHETFDVDGDDLDGPPAHPNCRCTVGLNS